MSLEGLRERNKGGKLDRLLKAAGRTSLGKKRENNDQETTFYPERDKSGNGSALIRFLPGLESEDYPYYVERFQHGFQFNNKWYIEFCPSTLDKDCPVCEDNFDTIGEYGRWDDCPVDVQDVIRKRGRNAGFRAGNYCNILVIKDPANPDNEGKVHRFNFGKAIMDLILDMAQPQDNGLGDVKDPVDVFDLGEGANFEFIIRKKDGRADYKQSKFEAPSKCPEFDEETQTALYPLVDKKLFKSYDNLSAKLGKVLNKKPNTNANKAEDMIDNKESANNAKEPIKNDAEKAADSVKADEAQPDDNMAYFQNLAEEVQI